MRAGIIQQVASPRILYEDPVNLFVAGFIGSPSMNFLPGRIDGETVRLPMGEVPIPAHLRSRLQARRADGAVRDVIVGIRPEHFEDAAVAGEAIKACASARRWRWSSRWAPSMYVYFDLATEHAESQQLEELNSRRSVGGSPEARRERHDRGRSARCGFQSRGGRRDRSRTRGRGDQALRSQGRHQLDALSAAGSAPPSAGRAPGFGAPWSSSAMKSWRTMGPPVAVAAVYCRRCRGRCLALAPDRSRRRTRSPHRAGERRTVDRPAGRLLRAGAGLALLSRLPALERAAPLDRRVAWHRPVAIACIGLLCAHAVLITAGSRLATASDCRRRSDGS